MAKLHVYWFGNQPLPGGRNYIGDVNDGTVHEISVQISAFKTIIDYVLAPDFKGDLKVETNPNDKGFYSHWLVHRTSGSMLTVGGIRRAEEAPMPKPKKELSDLCPKCRTPGKFGPRAMLMCPACQTFIGGLS